MTSISQHTEVGWKVHQLTKIISWNVTKLCLSFNLVTIAVHTILLLVLWSQCSKRLQQQIWTFQPRKVSAHLRIVKKNWIKILKICFHAVGSLLLLIHTFVFLRLFSWCELDGNYTKMQHPKKKKKKKKTVESLISHLRSPNKTNKICWTQLKK